MLYHTQKKVEWQMVELTDSGRRKLIKLLKIVVIIAVIATLITIITLVTINTQSSGE